MPTSRKKNTARIISDNDGETIDINISDASTADDESQQAPGVSRAAPTVVAPTYAGHGGAPANKAPSVVAPAAGILAPLLPSVPTTRSNHAYDINYFFTRGSKTAGTPTLCKICQ